MKPGRVSRPPTQHSWAHLLGGLRPGISQGAGPRYVREATSLSQRPARQEGISSGNSEASSLHRAELSCLLYQLLVWPLPLKNCVTLDN